MKLPRLAYTQENRENYLGARPFLPDSIDGLNFVNSAARLRCPIRLQFVNKEILEEHISQRRSLKQMADAGSVSVTTVRYWLRKYGLKGKAYGFIGRMTPGEISTAVSSSTSWTECLKRIGQCTIGSTPLVFKKRVAELGVSTSHFVPGYRRPNNPAFGKTQDDFLLTLTVDSRIGQGSLRRYIRKFGIIPYKCGICPIGPEWNGNPLVLQLDHRNGVRNDNRISNLRWLCPNCHSQTDTFGSKNKMVLRV